MDQKQIKRNLHYFTKTDTAMFVGIGLLVAGVLLFFLGYGYISYVLASVLAPVGIVLLLVGASKRVTDADIDACVGRLTDGMAVDIVENPKFGKRMLKQISPLFIQAYVLEPDLYLKRAASGSIRSEKYTASIVYALEDELYIVTRTVSLLADESEQQVLEISYADISGLSVEHGEQMLTVGKKTQRVSVSHLCVKGETELMLPMQSTADVDDFIARTHRYIAENK